MQKVNYSLHAGIALGISQGIPQGDHPCACLWMIGHLDFTMQVSLVQRYLIRQSISCNVISQHLLTPHYRQFTFILPLHFSAGYKVANLPPVINALECIALMGWGCVDERIPLKPHARLAYSTPNPSTLPLLLGIKGIFT